MPRLHYVMVETGGMKALLVGQSALSHCQCCLALEPVMVLWLSPLATSERHMMLAASGYLPGVNEVP